MSKKRGYYKMTTKNTLRHGIDQQIGAFKSRLTKPATVPVDIAAALVKLGVKGTVTVEKNYHYKVDRVSVDGEYFGLWDRRKKTFVD